MVKTRRTISIDPRVWDRAQEEAKRLRVSHSWVAETALRQLLGIDPQPHKALPAPSPPKPAA